MIRSFYFEKQDKPFVTPWVSKVAALKQKIEFKPGLNVLWGRNGCGKSTLLEGIARMFHCHQSGRQVITNSSRHYDVERHGDFTSLKIDHDGAPVMFFDPSQKVGLLSLGGAFDDDFLMEGVRAVGFKASTGQMTIQHFADRVITFERDADKSVKRKTNHEHKEWDAFLLGTGEKASPTILCDEPDRGLDGPTQLVLWRYLRAAARSYQVIVASHSLFALDLPEANYIEMTPNYLEEGRETLLALAGFTKEKPAFLRKAVEETPPEPKPKTRSKKKSEA